VSGAIGTYIAGSEVGGAVAGTASAAVYGGIAGAIGGVVAGGIIDLLESHNDCPCGTH
jgi:hypothetical protein